MKTVTGPVIAKQHKRLQIQVIIITKQQKYLNSMNFKKLLRHTDKTEQEAGAQWTPEIETQLGPPAATDQ